jgi:hypothetical protein
MNDSDREPRSAHNHESTTRNPMKRACMLGVMAAVIAAGTLFTAPAAQAQIKIKCESNNLSGPGGINVTWPFTTDVTACTGTTLENLLKMQGGLLAMVDNHSRHLGDGRQVGKGPVLQAMRPRVFLFKNPSDYAAFIKGSTCPPLPNNPGYSAFGFLCSLTGNKPYTVVFENFLLPDRPLLPPLLLPNLYIDLTAAHEMGHWFDNLILGTPKKPYSSSPIWTREMNMNYRDISETGDYPTINGLQYACSGSDVFNGLMDHAYPSSYICNNNGMGPGLSERYKDYAKSTNTVLLNAAVPDFYSVPKELFAEEAAVTTGDVKLDPSVDLYLHSRARRWNCTITLVLSMLNYGAAPGVPPSPYEVPINCPTK